ncbi:MAG: ATP-binding protein [Gammaproteobacteria bacterium]
MKFTLSHKLVLALLSLTLVVLIATLTLARWSFERGFLDYVNALEQVRLEQLRDDMVGEYTQAQNSWDSMTPERFRRLTRGDGPPPRRGGPGGRRPPPGDGFGEGPGDRRGPIPTALYSVENELIAGNVPDQLDAAIRVPVMLDSTPIGELRSAPRRQFVSPQETAFSSQQSRASWAIGAVSLGLALLVSLLLARGLLAPLRRMTKDVEQLSNGDYAVRIDATSSDELGQLSRDIDRLAMTLEQTRDSKQRWFADISHELRTPVTVLTGELEALKDGVRPFDATQAESLSQEVERLKFLIDDLYQLSLSDIGGLKYEFAPCNLKDVISHNVELCATRAAAASIALNSTLNDATVNADSKRLIQLIQNILENALAYTDSPGEIDISLNRTGEHVVIEIEDTPPGVTASECEHLFEPLYRLEASRNRRFGGAGLGLAICRNIVEAHSGQISASPSTKGGLHIKIELPEYSTS